MDGSNIPPNNSSHLINKNDQISFSFCPILTEIEPYPHQTRSQVCGNVDFTKSILYRVFHTINCISNDDASNRVYRSMLITSSKGGGKTTLLDTIRLRLESGISPINHDGVVVPSAKFTVFQISLNSIQNLSTSNLSNSIGDLQNPFQDSPASYKSSISQILRIIRPDGNLQEIDLILSTTDCILVLLIDDIDQLFDLFSLEEETWMGSRSSADDKYRTLKLLAYHLKNILDYQKQLLSPDNCIRTFVIGTSNYTLGTLPRSEVGCPQFEWVYALPKPSYSDRVRIISKMLIEDCRFRLEDISSAEPNAVDQTMFQQLLSSLGTNKEEDRCTLAVEKEVETVYSWATHLAKLTKGYVPGDLWSVLQRAYFLQSASNSLAFSETADPTGFLTWKLLLQALLSTALKATADLDFNSQSDFSSQTSRQLSWDSFVVSNDFKAHLQRLLIAFRGDKHNEVASGFAQLKLPKGFVIHGPSGCGKTLLSNIICKEVS